MKHLVTLCLVVAAGIGLARADDAAIRRSLEPKMGGVRIDSITATPVPGLFEVQYRSAEGVQVIYTDANGLYVIQGDHLIEVKAGRDLTEEKLRKLNAVPFDKLPLDMAVKVQRGNGRRVLAMFSDPYCPYCQRFERTLQEIDDVTIYVFMIPIIRPENADQSKAVWCSPDRAKAWTELALNHTPPSAPSTCDNPIEKNLQLSRSLRVQSTPTVILANGERFSGALGAAELRSVLDRAAPKR
ncbi:MAG: DsbC family protein [Betaproteobacteria bacterium]|nr:DsbC family protein [Betaproteobacteria bacterium]